MPRMGLRQCAVNGCPNLVEEAGDIYCKIHKPVEERKYNKIFRGYNANERYDSRWRKIRNKYIKEHLLCEECEKENHITIATIVHHKNPIENGGEKYDVKNLMSVCGSCHKKIHDKLGVGSYKFKGDIKK